MSPFRLFFVLFMALGTNAAAAATPDDLRDGRVGTIEFRSMTPRNPSELMARRGAATTIAGVLELPRPISADRVPAMVIAHGSGGILAGREHDWAGRLNALGVATLVIDSFGPRGIDSTGADQSRLSLAASVADALSALRVLATHPRIDPRRIGIMGFSKGGQVALYAALEPFRRAVIDDELRFATHVAFYASCSVPYKATATTAAPMLLLLGADDDYTPSGHCRRYADWLRSKGGDVDVITYDGAGHGFDVPTPPRYLAAAQSARNCRLDLWLDPAGGTRWDTGETLPAGAIGPYLRGCMQRGGTFGGSAAALTQAADDLAAYLRRTLLR
jgi:dienelactone hydrolase